MQKIRILFTLFITLPLIFSLSPEEGYAKPNEFREVGGEISKKIKAFKSKSDEEKDKILKELDSSISDLNEKIKKYISEKKKYPKGEIIVLMKNILYINLYMKNRGCKKEDKNCINEKKMLMNNLLIAVQYNLGKCPVTIEHITKLTGNTHANLIALTSLIQSIVDNKDLIEKSKINIIVNIINCLTERIDDYMKLIEKQYKHNPHIAPHLRKSHIEDMTNALSELNGFDISKKTKKKYKSDKHSFLTREDADEEIIDILKEIKASNKALAIIISCLATITILIGGFLLYRSIRRKNSNIIENTIVLDTSENKVNK